MLEYTVETISIPREYAGTYAWYSFDGILYWCIWLQGKLLERKVTPFKELWKSHVC